MVMNTIALHNSFTRNAAGVMTGGVSFRRTLNPRPRQLGLRSRDRPLTVAWRPGGRPMGVAKVLDKPHQRRPCGAPAATDLDGFQNHPADPCGRPAEEGGK